MNPLEYLFQPPILFFLLGVVAVLVRSDLEIPDSVLRVLSLYLLFSLGFKGGAELHKSTFTLDVLVPLGIATASSFVVPLLIYPLLRRKFSVPDSAAIAATYGSVSAVTFMTAAAYLQSQAMHFGGHMVAALALMESPAILIGLLLARSRGGAAPSWKTVLHECLANKSVLILLGALVAGFVSPERGVKSLQPFVVDLFPGLLCFFLLDLGLVAARRVTDLKAAGAFALAFALLFPLVSGGVALGVAWLAGFQAGDAVLFAILCGSGSYIAVPAALRTALPEANPSLYVGLALGLTFPFNLIVGIPLAYSMVARFWAVGV